MTTTNTDLRDRALAVLIATAESPYTSSDPPVFVFVIAVLEAERDVAIRLVPLQRSLQRLDHAVAELERERPATSR